MSIMLMMIARMDPWTLFRDQLTRPFNLIQLIIHKLPFVVILSFTEKQKWTYRTCIIEEIKKTFPKDCSMKGAFSSRPKKCTVARLMKWCEANCNEVNQRSAKNLGSMLNEVLNVWPRSTDICFNLYSLTNCLNIVTYLPSIHVKRTMFGERNPQ